MADERQTTEPVQPANHEQSGSTGRRAPGDGIGKGKDSGQDRYGQTGDGNPGKAGKQGEPGPSERVAVVEGPLRSTDEPPAGDPRSEESRRIRNAQRVGEDTPRTVSATNKRE
jgi:hypothetical protein